MSRSEIRRTSVRIALCLGILAASCQAPNVSLLDQQLRDGRVIRDVLTSELPTAILVYSPSMCYACSPLLSRWEAIANSGRVKLVLLMYEDPSPSDLRALRRQRIPVTGVLASWRWSKSLVPSEYLVQGGVIRARAEGADEVRAMSLWSHRLVSP